MIGGDPNRFLEVIYSGQEIYFCYNNINYFYQGYWEDSYFFMEIWEYDNPEHPYLWQHKGTDPVECLQSFEDAPIFNGRTFRNAEKDIEWLEPY